MLDPRSRTRTDGPSWTPHAYGFASRIVFRCAGLPMSGAEAGAAFVAMDGTDTTEMQTTVASDETASAGRGKRACVTFACRVSRRSRAQKQRRLDEAQVPLAERAAQRLSETPAAKAARSACAARWDGGPKTRVRSRCASVSATAQRTPTKRRALPPRARYRPHSCHRLARRAARCMGGCLRTRLVGRGGTVVVLLCLLAGVGLGAGLAPSFQLAKVSE